MRQASSSRVNSVDFEMRARDLAKVVLADFDGQFSNSRRQAAARLGMVPFGPLSNKGGRHPPISVRTISRPLPTRGSANHPHEIGGGPDGVRVTCPAWDDAVVVLPDQVSNHERQVTSSAGIGPPSVRRHPPIS
jgi:hypothetical protein